MGRLLGDQDRAYHDRVATEVNRLFGTASILYYPLEHTATPKDALYGEPTTEIHKTNPRTKAIGFPFEGFMEYPEPSPRTGEEGRRVDHDAVLWIARVDVERAFPLNPVPTVGVKYREPRYGDIVEVQGRFYDVIKIVQDGHLNDTMNVHTMWILNLKNRSEFDARRRIEGQV